MQQNFNIELLFPCDSKDLFDWELFKQYKPDIPFSDDVLEYLNALSKIILKDKESRLYPDIVTFAFYCRKANLLYLKKQYESKGLRLGRGVLFHIAPSNVPINCGYSLIVGLLSGNYNIVRISSKSYPQVDLLVRSMNELRCNEVHMQVSSRIALVRYDRMSSATDFFSSFCNARVIWGGDETIEQIRKSSIPARSLDVTFADRYSFAVINADKFIDEDNVGKIVEGFYNDTYLFDQNACSAPRLIVWKGDTKNIARAKEIFWNAVQSLVDSKYNFQSVLAVDKLTAMYMQAVGMDIKKEVTINNNVVRVNLYSLPKDIDNYRCAGGYFSEYDIENLSEISHIIKEKYQTLAYYGFTQEELQNFVVENHLRGLDRIVPVGKTTEFSMIWDGYDLISTLSRVCSLNQ